jgi:hypothetical protein
MGASHPIPRFCEFCGQASAQSDTRWAAFVRSVKGEAVVWDCGLCANVRLRLCSEYTTNPQEVTISRQGRVSDLAEYVSAEQGVTPDQILFIQSGRILQANESVARLSFTHEITYFKSPR